MEREEMIEKMVKKLEKADITMVRIVYHFAMSVLRQAKR